MNKLVKSAGGIIYYYDENNDIRFLLIKRHALSGKIERVAPKGKIQIGETDEKAALREVSEETGIPLNFLSIIQNIGSTTIEGLENKNGKFNKEVVYFLIKYDGDPELVDIQPVEGYLGTHKRATIQEVLNLVYYTDIRELFRKGYVLLRDKQKINDVKKDFLKKLEL
ncbi:MAG TPA: NUDIX domain-containing protein [Candidatus Absconditabacterales bacterium]|nr:NUDIX domain-containing protein [Candidatus Absconditabacterales bacterium]HOQ78628.1 NUDIX domain-containing protein [Candidatus Absconditabacterales bacterium]HPK27795.1 NUDIX domain-containing protein [Candidatus Absconditabacterales bacterium]